MLVQSLFVQQTSALRGFILALQPDFAVADDVVQEVFLTVTAKAEDFHPGTNFAAWVRAIARYKIKEAARQRSKGPEPLPDDLLDLLCAEEPEPEPHREATLRHLAHCLGRLAPKSHLAVRLRYEEGHSPSEVARHLEWTPEAVYVALARARAALRECVERRLHQESAA